MQKKLGLLLLSFSFSWGVFAQSTVVVLKDHVVQTEIVVKDKLTCKIEDRWTGYIPLPRAFTSFTTDEIKGTLFKHEFFRNGYFPIDFDGATCQPIREILADLDNAGKSKVQKRILVKLHTYTPAKGKPSRRLQESVILTFPNETQLNSHQDRFLKKGEKVPE